MNILGHRQFYTVYYQEWIYKATRINYILTMDNIGRHGISSIFCE